jgi:HK97 family phage major capsid protein
MSDNTIRRLARVVTLTDGQPAWNGITSAGVTASWDGEVVEVSDDSPTFGNPQIPTERAQALVQASISAAEDIANLATDVMMMFADAKDRLEGAAHANGPGTNDSPTGVFAAVAAVTASRVVSTPAATIGLVDLNSVYTGVPARYRRNSTWVANPVYTVAIKALGTALSASYSGDLTEPVAGRILGRPLVESDDAPTTQTTTALDREVLLGDFQQYVIVDRPAGMSVEYIPHLFNTSNNLPDGRRAWYASWRNGADVTNVDAFRLLVDKTTA